ncbi:MAG: TRAP transporter small permease [Pseudomonadota bacterium]|uniref:TRAP transporter small permease n=1 Tax=Halomonas sp. IOP_31 TaxID=2876584 RepID=UPI001E632D1C|nr:TRAP transporter small permease [Halomonas sp. IOP_31]MCD6009104.1 TRAP transporter small permease [Halomonas sp. IOP_31]MEA3253123.1 TRAP transporter small permease [Pseudomonadota bacterium]
MKSRSGNDYLNKLISGLDIIIGLLVIGVVITVSMNVIGRFVFNYSFAWAAEISRLLFIWMVLLGAGIASLTNEHVAVTLFKDKAPPALRKIFALLSATIIYAVCISIFVGFDDILSGYVSSTPFLAIPQTVLYSAMVVMAVLTVIGNSLFLYNVFKRGAA